ncbi:MAG: pyridoxal-phosphate dependent enzyme [Polyangiaceae bacterium]
MVCGVGSGGTISGLSRYFARVAPNVDIVLGDPAGSVLTEYVRSGKVGEAGSWLVEGVGEDFVPSICDLSRVRHAFTIADEESLTTARELLVKEGILAGSSSGLLVAAALRYCRQQTSPKRVVTFICDSGNKYLSKMFNDLWMREQGFLRTVGFGDLRDLVSRRADDGAVVSVTPDETLLIAYQRMKLADVSQVPVLEGSRIVGLLDESDLLLSLHDDPGHFRDPVRTIMTSNLVTVDASASIESLTPLLDRGLVVIVLSETRFFGLITRMDLLTHLRRKLG